MHPVRVRAGIGSIARRALPRARRWDRLLSSLQLDPDALERPLVPPGVRDFLVCGSPRTGTALLASMLWQPPKILCVMEPWDALRLPPAELFASLRAEVELGSLARGRLDVTALEATGQVRWCRDGERPVSVEVTGDWTLGVKMPAFWRYLDLLPDTRFVVCLRSPLDVIASYRATEGRLRLGLEYDAAFNSALNAELEAATRDPMLRRVMLFDQIHRALLPHLGRDNVHVVRYERWFTEPAAVLDGLGRFLDVDLGEPRARVGSPMAPPLPELEAAIVRESCTTAAVLGYDL